MNKYLKEALVKFGGIALIAGIVTPIVYVSVISYQCATNSEFVCTPPFSWFFKAGATARSSATSDLNLIKYNNLRSGMTYSEAVITLGKSGTETSRVEIPNTPLTILYIWQNPDGSNLNATFQDDKLVTKAQFGLK